MQRSFSPRPVFAALVGAAFVAACGNDFVSTDGTEVSSSAGGGKNSSSGGTAPDVAGAGGSSRIDINDITEIDDGVTSTGGTASGGSAVGEGGLGGASPEPSLIETLVPFQEWDSSGEFLTGILYAAASDAYGTALSWGRNTSTAEPPQPYLFSAEGSSPYALYFPSTGEGNGLNFLEDWNVTLADGQVVQYDAARFGPHVPNDWGLELDAYLVALQVNDGRGSDDSLHFIATDVIILDATTKIPMRSVDAMAEASADFDASLLSAESEMNSMLEEARSETSPPADTFFDPTSGQGVWPTWFGATERLQLTFMARRDESWTEYLEEFDGSLEGGERKPSLAIPVRPRLTHSYTVEYLIVYSIDPEGVVQSRTEHGPHIFHRTIRDPG